MDAETKNLSRKLRDKVISFEIRVHNDDPERARELLEEIKDEVTVLRNRLRSS